MTPDVALFSVLLLGAALGIGRKIHDIYHFVVVPQRAQRLITQGNYAEAIALLEPLLLRYNYADALLWTGIHYHLALAYQETQQYEKAAEQARAAFDTFNTSRHPEWYLALNLVLVDSLLAQGREIEAQNAISHGEKVLQKTALRVRLPLLRAKWLEYQFRFAEAASEMEQWLKDDGHKHSADYRHQWMLYLIGLYCQAGRHDEGIEVARRIKRDKPAPAKHVTACRLAGTCACTLANLDEALQWYAEAFEIAHSLNDSPLLASCEELYAEIQFAQGRIDEALKTIAGIYPGTPAEECSNLPVRACLLRGDYPAVFRQMAKLRETFDTPLPRINILHKANTELWLARASLEMGEAEQALTYLHQAAPIVEIVDSDRFYCESLRLWAMTLLDAENTETQAQVRAFERTLLDHVETHNGDAWDVHSTAGFLSIAACNIGDYEMGLRLVNLFAQPRHAPVYDCVYFYHLALSLEGTGQIAEARTAYEKCIAAGIDLPRVQKAQAALARLA